MHKEILTKEQLQLLPMIKNFSTNFGLVGGTAIALQIGHRQSVDFDLFSNKKFQNLEIRKNIVKQAKIESVFIDTSDEYTILVKGVKITFFHYPFPLKFSLKIDELKVADLLILSSLKAFALGKRAKWKDYVDLYFIMKDYYNLKQIVKKANKIFDNEFNEKIFRSQLVYFKDIDYTEKVIFMKDFEVPDKIIKEKLIEFALS